MFMKKIYFVSLLLLVFTVFCFELALAAQDNLKYQEDQIVKKTEQLKEIQLQIDNIKQESDNIHTKFDLIDKDNKNKQLNHEKAKESYNRASQNVDIINPEQMAQLLRAYQQTTKELKESNEELTKVKNDKNYIEEKLQNLTNKKNQTEIEILQIKADIFEVKSREPIWVEGEGEAILDENKTMKECEKLALEYAKRDAIEKGGKALVQSVTKVSMFQLVQDDIKLSSKIQIVEQDNSADYGIAKKVMSGDIIKYVAKVRLKIQSADDYNPYREQIAQLTGKKITEERQKLEIAMPSTTARYKGLVFNENKSRAVNYSITGPESKGIYLQPGEEIQLELLPGIYIAKGDDGIRKGEGKFSVVPSKTHIYKGKDVYWYLIWKQ